MPKLYITSQISQEPTETTTPNQGTVVFSCSTENFLLYRESPFSDIYHWQGTKRDELYNLL